MGFERGEGGEGFVALSCVAWQVTTCVLDKVMLLSVQGYDHRGAKVLHTYLQTDPPTKRVLEEHSLLKRLS